MIGGLLARRVMTSLLDLPDDVMLLILALVVDCVAELLFPLEKWAFYFFEEAALKKKVQVWTYLLLVCRHMYRLGKQLTLEITEFNTERQSSLRMRQQVGFASSIRMTHPPARFIWCSVASCFGGIAFCTPLCSRTASTTW